MTRFAPLAHPHPLCEARAEDVNWAVEAARQAFDTGPWPRLSHLEREAPGAAYVFAEICEKVGLPPGVVNVLTAERMLTGQVCMGLTRIIDSQ
jgi:acyl-CoA reductase-like NAD-dependent aldehyde dehydrogenase